MKCGTPTNYIIGGGIKKKHKYVAKIKITPKYTRYFYSNEEYQNFLKRGKSVIENKLGYTVGNTVDVVSLTNKDKKTKTESEKFTERFEAIKLIAFGPVVSLGSKFVSKFLPSKNDSNSEKEFKYIAKIELPNGKTRYFYDQDEYDAYLKRKEYQDNEPDYMKDLPETVEPMTADEDMLEINEDYEQSVRNGDYLRTNYCKLCTVAYELRRRGYDVEASDYKEGLQANVFQNYFWGNTAIYKNAKSEKYETSDVVSELSKQPGTRGDLSFMWSGTRSGHSVAYEVSSDGSVTFRDCQTQRVYTDDKSYVASSDNIKTYPISKLINDDITDCKCMRTDNLEIRKEALCLVQDN